MQLSLDSNYNFFLTCSSPNLCKDKTSDLLKNVQKQHSYNVVKESELRYICGMYFAFQYFFLQVLWFKTKQLIKQKNFVVNYLICLFLITAFKVLELQCSSSHLVLLFTRWN